MKRHLMLSVVAVLAIILLAGMSVGGCGTDEEKPENTKNRPYITSISPESGPAIGQAFTKVKICGRNFGEEKGRSIVCFGGRVASAIWSDTELTITVHKPDHCLECDIVVYTDEGISNVVQFQVIPDIPDAPLSEAQMLTADEAGQIISAMIAATPEATSCYDLTPLKKSAIDPDWAIGYSCHRRGNRAQGQNYLLHKEGGIWKVVDIGSGVVGGDHGSPSDLN